MVSTLTQQRF